jgi:oxygen-independent coproporphyrinogen-3 oxidase
LNVSDIRAYLHKIEAGSDTHYQIEQLDTSRLICETAVLNLRRRRGISLTRFKDSTGTDFADVFAEPIHRYVNQGLMELSGDVVRLTRDALPVADAILCDFAAI